MHTFLLTVDFIIYYNFSNIFYFLFQFSEWLGHDTDLPPYGEFLFVPSLSRFSNLPPESPLARSGAGSQFSNEFSCKLLGFILLFYDVMHESWPSSAVMLHKMKSWNLIFGGDIDFVSQVCLFFANLMGYAIFCQDLCQRTQCRCTSTCGYIHISRIQNHIPGCKVNNR